jgi:hypothetical protein
MPPGISGSLIPSGFLHDVLPSRFPTELAAAGRTAPFAALSRWWRRVHGQLGPASSARAVLDVAVLPLVRMLGYQVLHLEPHGAGFAGAVGVERSPLAVLLVLPWSGSPEDAWRDLQRAGRATGARWGVVCTGCRVRVFDATRTWSRRALDFDLQLVMADERSVLTLWMLATAAALDSRLLERVVAAADEHAIAVCASLGDGVLAALGALVAALDPPSLKPRARSGAALAAPEAGLT